MRLFGKVINGEACLVSENGIVMGISVPKTTDTQALLEMFIAFSKDMQDESLKMADEFGGYWSEHPEYPEGMWKEQIADNMTRLGYWLWVKTKIGESKDEENVR